MNCDYMEAIDRIDFPGAFFYCDPPYPLESRGAIIKMAIIASTSRMKITSDWPNAYTG